VRGVFALFEVRTTTQSEQSKKQSNMSGVETVLNAAKSVYNKICQLQTDREEVSSLALRVHLLIGSLSSLEGSKTNANRNKIMAQIEQSLIRANHLVSEFGAIQSSKLDQFMRSGKYAERCESINKEMNEWIQLLGVDSDEQQLRYLGDIQNVLEERRQHDEDVSVRTISQQL